MKIKIGVLGSADSSSDKALVEKARALGIAIAGREAILVTGATTGLVHETGKAAHDEGGFHVGVSPAANAREHLARYRLPADACDAIIYTGFGLKGRNVVLVRSCDVTLFLAGSFGALNEFTIAYDEGKVIGCLTGTGGVADEAERLVAKFQKLTEARIFYADDPERLLDKCIAEFRREE
jgi:uncharacterized protein (TIGR00725 family)